MLLYLRKALAARGKDIYYFYSMQRIAIARAVYSNHPILLLDEATSALDEATALRLLNNLRKMTDKTVILVTHRMNQTGFFDAELAFSKDGICVRERKTCK